MLHTAKELQDHFKPSKLSVHVSASAINEFLKISDAKIHCIGLGNGVWEVHLIR